MKKTDLSKYMSSISKKGRNNLKKRLGDEGFIQYMKSLSKKAVKARKKLSTYPID